MQGHEKNAFGIFQVRNTESARVSMPGQLTNSLTGNCAASEVLTKEETENRDSKRLEEKNSLEGYIPENRYFFCNSFSINFS